MAADGGLQPLSFVAFLDKMKDPAAADLVRAIKIFVHQFERRPSGAAVDPEADSAAVQDFLARMEASFRGHAAWRGAGPEVVEQAVEGLEKYLMSKLFARTFAASREDADRDERYARLASALSFVSLAALAGGAADPDPALAAAAQAELLKMDRYKAPRDKLLCLVNVKTLVEDIVGAAARGGGGGGGADAFFPVFLLLVIRARPPRLASNVEYVRRFRSRARLTGQFDFMLSNLESAAVYLDTVDWRHLGIPQDEFLARLAQAGLPEAEMELRARRAAAEAAEAAGAAGPAGRGATAAVAAAEARAAGGGAEAPLAAADAGGADAPASPPSTAAAAGEEAAAAFGSPAAQALDVVVGGGSGESSAAEEPQLQAASPLPRHDHGGDVPAIDTPTTKAQAFAAGVPSLELPPTPPNAGVDLGAGASLLTPVGGLETPVLLPHHSTRWQTHPAAPDDGAAAPPLPPAPAGGGASAGLAGSLVADMVSEGTSLVLEEEAAGRLQQRHPWLYAAAEDLSMGDVGLVLGAYRDVVLKYEALSLVLQQQLGDGGGGAADAAADGAAPSAVAASDVSAAGLASSAGALLSRLSIWGRAPVPPPAPAAPAAEHGARGKAGDAQLLHALFGASPQQRRQAGGQQHGGGDAASPAAGEAAADLLDLSESGGGGGQGSPALPAAAQDAAPQAAQDSLI